MSEIEIYQPHSEIAVHDDGHRDIDSWIAVVSDVIKIANVVYDTPFVPDGLRGSAPAVAAAMLAGREMGLGIMTSLANIDVIKGKPTQKALLMRAMVLSHGHKWEDVDVTDSRAVVRGCRKGESSWTEVTFTDAHAKRAGIDLGKYPADKLYARASSRLARRKFADVIMGMPYTPEDLEDGADDDEIGTVTDAAAPAPGQPKTDRPRTAQRAKRSQNASPAQAEPPSAEPATGVPAHPQGAGEALPPLPGEEEAPPGAAADAAPGEPDDTDYDTPGTATSGPKGQLTKLGAVFTGLGFTSKEREQRLVTASQIIGREIESSSDLSFNEARMLIDTLERCGTRDNLVALLVNIEKYGGETDA